MTQRQFFLVGVDESGQDAVEQVLRDFKNVFHRLHMTYEPIPVNRQRTAATYEHAPDVPIPNTWFTQAFVDAMCSGEGPEVAAFAFEELVRERLFNGERLFLTESNKQDPSINATPNPRSNMSDQPTTDPTLSNEAFNLEGFDTAAIPVKPTNADEVVVAFVMRGDAGFIERSSSNPAGLENLGSMVQQIADVENLSTDDIYVTIRTSDVSAVGSINGTDLLNQLAAGNGNEPSDEGSSEPQPDQAPPVDAEPTTGEQTTTSGAENSGVSSSSPAERTEGFQPPTDEQAGISGGL